MHKINLRKRDENKKNIYLCLIKVGVLPLVWS